MSAGKDLSTPFPCQDRPCGCRSADQCWKQCCCFTNSQKLTWAQANNVTPPDFVLLGVQTEAKPLKSSCCSKAVAECCAQSQQSDQEALNSKSSCCTEVEIVESQADIHQIDSTESSENRDVVILAALQKCQGGGPYAFSIPWGIADVPLVPLNLLLPSAEKPEFRIGCWES